MVLYPRPKKEENVLPKAQAGEELKLLELETKQNFTQPPPRYTEGSLVKELEAKGIGRPSTYAPIIATIQVFTEPTALRPLTNTISSTWSPLMKVYRDAFVTGDLYSAAATSIVIAGVSLILSFGFLRVVRNRAFGEG